jgi:adenosylmethionine-8-amino-7-oxononanoate aminotransferase
MAREQSYHGNTLGALDLSGHEARKALYKEILPGNMRLIPACNLYRRDDGLTDKQYVQWHREQIVSEIEDSGGKTAAMIVEPVVGAVSLTFSSARSAICIFIPFSSIVLMIL